MLKSLFLFTVLLFSLVFSATSHSAPDKEITVLRLTIPSSPVTFITDAVSETLKDNGYKVNYEGFSSCAAGYSWQKSHPTEKSIFILYENYVLPNLIDPNNTLGCYFTINEQTLVTTIGRWWWYVCGHMGTNPTIGKFITERNKTISVWGYPIVVNSFKKIFAAMGAHLKIVGTPSGGDAIELFNTGDVDYYLGVTKSTLARLKGAECFATTANKKETEKYFPGYVSFQSVNANVPFKGLGMDPKIIAVNVDEKEMKSLRKIFKNNPSSTYIKIRDSYAPEERTIKEQVQDLQTQADNLKEE